MAGPSLIFAALWVTALKIERDYITARRRDQPSHIILKEKRNEKKEKKKQKG
jgi:hypothetical protein